MPVEPKVKGGNGKSKRKREARAEEREKKTGEAEGRLGREEVEASSKG